MKHAATALVAAFGLSMALLSGCAGASIQDAGDVADESEAAAQHARDVADESEAASQEAESTGEPSEAQGNALRTEEATATVDANVKTFSVQEEAGEGAVLANVVVTTAACDASAALPDAAYTTVAVTLRDESSETGLSARPMEAAGGMVVAMEPAGNAPIVRSSGPGGRASVTGASGASCDIDVSQAADDGMTVSVTDANGQAAVVTVALAEREGRAAMEATLMSAPAADSGLQVVETDSTESVTATCCMASEVDKRDAAIARTVLIDVSGAKTRDVKSQEVGETTTEESTSRNSWNKEVTTTVESTPTKLEVHDVTPLNHDRGDVLRR